LYLFVCGFFGFCSAGVESRATHLLGRCSSARACCYSYFWIGLHVYAHSTWTARSCLHLLHIWDDRCTPLVQLLLTSWDRILWTFCLGWPQTLILPNSLAGIIGMTPAPGLIILIGILWLMYRFND
jgi:hypothetical protein